MVNERLATKILLKMNEAVENGDKNTFMKIMKEEGSALHNVSFADEFLSSKTAKVYRKALEKFI